MATWMCDYCLEVVETATSRFPSDMMHRITGDYGSACMPTDDGADTVGKLCNKCYDKYHNPGTTITCSSCNNDTQAAAISYIGSSDEFVCGACVIRYFFYCNHCDQRFDRRTTNVYHPANDGLICEGCYDDHYFHCDGCGETIHNDNLGSGDYCVDCDGERENDDGSLIKDYSYKPRPQFFGSGKLFFGCELEVAVSDRHSLDDKAEDVLNALNSGDNERVYLKHDSSIGRGFEIVTHPHSWDEVVKLWTEKWDEHIAGLSSHNSGTCGFHVHVSRKALTKMHIQKLVVFINAPENADLVRKIAQRNCTQWGIIKTDKRIGHCGHSDDRYEAINLSNNNTIEFRIFRGNTRKERIMKNLEFVKASIDFTRDRSYRDLSADNFFRFVCGQRKAYKNLYAYLQEFYYQSDSNSPNLSNNL